MKERARKGKHHSGGKTKDFWQFSKSGSLVTSKNHVYKMIGGKRRHSRKRR